MAAEEEVEYGEVMEALQELVGDTVVQKPIMEEIEELLVVTEVVRLAPVEVEVGAPLVDALTLMLEVARDLL